MTAPKAWRLALSKAAEEDLSLALSVLGVKEEKRALDPMLESLEAESALYLTLTGPGGALGVAVVDPSLLAGLIEVQTLGRVLSREAAPRIPTRTDGAMCEAVLNRALAEFAAHMRVQGRAQWAEGFACGAPVENTRLLGLMLEDVPYRIFRLSLDLQSGAKTGELILAFPPGICPGSGAGRGDDGWRTRLNGVVMASEVRVEAVLHRLSLPLARIEALKAGDFLEIPSTAITDVTLEGADGKRVARAHLGQQNGMRALRILPARGAEAPDAPTLPGHAMPDAPVQQPQAPGSVDSGQPPPAPAAPPPGLPDLPDAAAPEQVAPDAAPPDMSGAEPLPDLALSPMPMDIEIG